MIKEGCTLGDYDDSDLLGELAPHPVEEPEDLLTRPASQADPTRRQQALLTRLLLAAPDVHEVRAFFSEGLPLEYFDGPRAAIAAWLLERYRDTRSLPSLEECRARFGDIAETGLVPESDRPRVLSGASSLPGLLTAARDAYVERRLGETLTAAAQQFSDPTRRRETYATLQRGLRDVAAAESRSISTRTLAQLTDDVAARYRAAQTQQLWGVPIPLPFLNQALQGWQPAELAIILARPAVGKTWLICMCAIAAAAGDPWMFTDPERYQLPRLTVEQRAKDARRVLFVSMEMPPLDIANRLTALCARVKYTPFRHGKLATDDETRLYRALELLNKNEHVGGRIQLTSIASVPQIVAAVERFQAQLLIIDGFYMMAGHGEKRWERVQENLQALRQFQLASHVPVLLTSQFAQQDDRAAFSQSVEQDASVLLEMSRGSDGARLNQIYIKTRKVREGKVGDEYRYNWNPDEPAFDEVGPATRFGGNNTARRRGP